LEKTFIARRFRGFLPVVVDVETGGFDPERDALLEMAAVLLAWSPGRGWHRGDIVTHHIEPFSGANLEEASLQFNKIDPYHPFRMAVPEKKALTEVFKIVSEAVAAQGCTRAILVGHNAAFDLAFVKAAALRLKLRNNPFHQFSTFDTAAIAGVALGQTVLSRAVEAAGIDWNPEEAHSAMYDAEKTAELFCLIVNRWDEYNRGTQGEILS
jgi:ribonuclease T|tara:strand:- start:88 stop:720 length:633 start_codon:yes stop_codon:yes gene_type:complete